ALIQGLARTPALGANAGEAGFRIVTSDLAPLPESVKALSAEHVQGDLVYKVKNFYDYDFDVIFHRRRRWQVRRRTASMWKAQCNYSCWPRIGQKNTTRRCNFYFQVRSRRMACPVW